MVLYSRSIKQGVVEYREKATLHDRPLYPDCEHEERKYGTRLG